MSTVASPKYVPDDINGYLLDVKILSTGAKLAFWLSKEAVEEVGLYEALAADLEENDVRGCSDTDLVLDEVARLHYQLSA